MIILDLIIKHRRFIMGGLYAFFYHLEAGKKKHKFKMCHLSDGTRDHVLGVTPID